MIDVAQIVIFVVIVLLTILLLVLGVQVFIILREVRVTVKKANKVLEDAGMISENLSGPIASISTWSTGIKTGSSLLKLLLKKKKLFKTIVSDDSDE